MDLKISAITIAMLTVHESSKKLNGFLRRGFLRILPPNQENHRSNDNSNLRRGNNCREPPSPSKRQPAKRRNDSGNYDNVVRSIHSMLILSTRSPILGNRRRHGFCVPTCLSGGGT